MLLFMTITEIRGRSLKQTPSTFCFRLELCILIFYIYNRVFTCIIHCSHYFAQYLTGNTQKVLNTTLISPVCSDHWTRDLSLVQIFGCNTLRRSHTHTLGVTSHFKSTHVFITRVLTDVSYISLKHLYTTYLIHLLTRSKLR